MNSFNSFEIVVAKNKEQRFETIFTYRTSCNFRVSFRLWKHNLLPFICPFPLYFIFFLAFDVHFSRKNSFEVKFLFMSYFSIAKLSSFLANPIFKQPVSSTFVKLSFLFRNNSIVGTLLTLYLHNKKER